MSAPEELSKSARKRANQKAREAEGAAAAVAAAAPVVAEPPKAKAKAKGKAEPKAEPKAEAKAKAKGKAEPKAAVVAPKAEAKAKGKAKAAPPSPAVAPAEAPAEPKKAAKKKKNKEEKPEEAPKPPKADDAFVFEIDDGKGGDWEMASGVSKKQAKQNEKRAREEEEAKEAKIALAKAEKAAQKAGAAVVAKSGDSKKDNKAEKMLAAADEILARARENAKNPKAFAAAAVAKAAADAAAPKKEEEVKVDDGSVTASIAVPDGKIGRIIGPKGANIELIKSKTGVTSIDTQGGQVTILGQPAEVALAEKAVKELIEKGFMSMSYEDFKEDSVMVPSSAIPNIIGERGAIIQVIKKECVVEVNIDQGEKGKGKGDGKGKPDRNAKVKVVLAGESKGVEMAKEVINSIALFGHSEITHPGWSHEEMDIEDWKYRFIIGAGGSEMRHIQNNFKVKVNIPREGSGSDKVVVIGEAADVDRAVKYITKVTENAEQPTGRDKPEKAEDTWGDEGPSEPWMDAYMYKRR